MAGGLIIGLVTNYLSPTSGLLQVYLIDGFFHIIGALFIASLKMLVVPIVFVSLVCGTCSLGDTTKLGRLGIKAVGLYLATTAFAVILALMGAVLVGPGKGSNLEPAAFVPKEAPPLIDVLINLFPTNPIRAMAEGNMLQVIVFAVLFGIAISLSGKAGERIASFFNDINEIIMKLVLILMNLAPYGVFCLIAKLFATF